MSNDVPVPFNDLARIHRPLIPDFQVEFTKLIESSSLVLGEQVSAFETELAIEEGVKYATGVNSGTSAIELALRALGIGPGDEVITTAFTFVATCFAIMQTGAKPVLIDIDPATGLMDPLKIEQAITKKSKAVVFVTLHGRVESLAQIRDLCVVHNLRFVIDAAQSHLGTFDGKPQSEFADVSTLSFYPGKNLGALGEGGAVLTNSREIRDRIVLMRDWGAKEKYVHEVWGGNFRLEPLQASILRIKLRNLKTWTQDRQRIAEAYRRNLNPSVLTKSPSNEGSHVYHIFAINVANRSKVCAALGENSVGFGFHYPRAIHQQPAYAFGVTHPWSLENAEWLANSTLSIPIFPLQTELEIERVLEVINSVV